MTRSGVYKAKVRYHTWCNVGASVWVEPALRLGSVVTCPRDTPGKSSSDLGARGTEGASKCRVTLEVK